MKKIITIIMVLTIVIYACEKDDFCIQNPITPKLMLRFYDANSPLQKKSVARFSAIAESKIDSLYKTITTDSIVIPLNPNANRVIYLLKRNILSGNIADNDIDTLTINYTFTEDYVSRSCGFKITYSDVALTLKNSWITSITPTNLENINSQNAAHVQVFH